MDNHASQITFGPGDEAERPDQDGLPPELLELFDYSIRAANMSLDSPGRGMGGLWLLVSLVVFMLANLGGFDWIRLGLLVGVLLLHETGHFLGMKFFGYRNVTMFFIPFFGAAVTGKKHAVAAWKEIIVLLLGPVPGLLLGAALYFALRPVDTKSVPFQAISMLLILNAFNPLDGGRIMNLLIFRRHPILEVLFKLFAVGGLVLSAVLFLSWILGVVAILTLISIPFGYNIARRARQLRQRIPGIAAEWNELGLPELKHLFLQAVEILPTDRVPMNIGKRMLMLHEQAAANSPGLAATFLYLAVYWFSFLIGPTMGLVIAVHLNAERARAQELANPLHRPSVASLCTEARELLDQAHALQVAGMEPAPPTRARIRDLAQQADAKVDEAGQLLLQDVRFGMEARRETMLQLGELKKECLLLKGGLDGVPREPVEETESQPPGS
jgi:hypothetical protein